MSHSDSHQAERLAVLDAHEDTVAQFPASQLQPEEAGSNFWVLLWSQSQNALHVESLADMLQNNREAYSENRRTDYVPLVIAARELVQGVADSVRGTLRLREQQRSEGFLQ